MRAGRRPVLCFAVFAVAAILLPAAILAVLGYHSLRRWETTSALLFREQSREMAAMAAEKVRMVLARTEEEALDRVRVTLERDGARPGALDDTLGRTPFIARLYILDHRGRLLFPVVWTAADADVIAALEREVGVEGDDRSGLRYLQVGSQLVATRLIRRPGGEAMRIGIVRDAGFVQCEVLAKTLGGIEGPAVLAVVDPGDRPIYARQGLDRTDRVVALPLGEAFPTWRLALYQPVELSPRQAVERQTTLFMVAFGLLLLVIAAGLAATYRLVRRETQMAELKADFVANVSHDLKTPLSLIRMYSETLEMGRVTDASRRQDYYRVMTRESERLSRLIDNVLDFSRIDRGRQRYHIEPIPVEPVVRDAVEAYRAVFAEGGFKVNVSIDPHLPGVPLDPDAVRQALANLIDNAVKFSDTTKAITVGAHVAGDALAIEVADEGIGIPPEEHVRIFDKFYRIGRSDTQGRRGSGMGLALVEHIVLAHGGRVTVDSLPGRGSRFTLRFPLHPLG